MRKPFELQDKKLDSSEYRQAQEQILNFTAHVKMMRIDFETTLRTIIKVRGFGRFDPIFEAKELLKFETDLQNEIAEYPQHLLKLYIKYFRKIMKCHENKTSLDL